MSNRLFEMNGTIDLSDSNMHSGLPRWARLVYLSRPMQVRRKESRVLCSRPIKRRISFSAAKTVGRVQGVRHACVTQDVTMGRVNHLGSAIAKRVGEVCSATKISTFAQTTNLAETEPRVWTRAKVPTPVFVQMDMLELIVKRGAAVKTEEPV